MKKYVLLTLILLNFTGALNAKALWHIRAYAYDSTGLKEGIDRMWNEGYYPADLEIIPGKRIYVLFTARENPSYQNWSLETYNLKELDGKQVQDKIQGQFEQKIVPVGLSQAGDTLCVLFVQMSEPPSRWRIETVASRADKIEETADSLTPLGFTARGISVGKNQTLLLLLSSPDYFNVRVLDLPDNDEEVRKAIDGLAQSGYIPLGFSYQAGKIIVLATRAVEQ